MGNLLSNLTTENYYEQEIENQIKAICNINEEYIKSKETPEESKLTSKIIHKHTIL
jgi:hypothetical protein